jgi:hypothetical protein
MAGIEEARPAVGRIALARDPLVPIVIRSRRVLNFDSLEPGILTRRLIEVAVDTDVARLAHKFLRTPK